MKLKFLIPKHLHKFIFKEDVESQDETRQYEQTFQAHFVQKSDFPILVSTKDKKYLLHWESLTFREQEVLALSCMGRKNFEIADKLSIGDATVKTHLQAIFQKFGIRDRHDIRLALKDWDFESWRDERQHVPRPLPHTTTDR